MYYLLVILATMLPQEKSFKEKQLDEDHVKQAYHDKEVGLKEDFKKAGLDFQGFQIFIRGFKKEGELEVWIKDKSKKQFSLFRTYPFCATSGVLGPKRKEGDLQIPEGVYTLNHFNPRSNFYLSLGISYPNAADKVFSDKKSPGGAIYIHGNCVTIGCIPITDDKIKELYLLAVEARNSGQSNIPIHIFPTKLSNDALQLLISEEGSTHRDFWTNLQAIYLWFEKNKTPGKISVNTQGRYQIKS